MISFRSLSGRFLLLTVIFVMLAEVLIFVPSIARFRQSYLQDRLERAQIASLSLLADDMITADLEEELLQNAGVYNVVLRRDAARQLVLSSPLPAPVAASYDLRNASAYALIRDALAQLWDREERVIRVIGQPVRRAGLLIEVTLNTDPLCAAMVDYSKRILVLSAVISLITAALLFVAVRWLLVMPIRRVAAHMQAYAAAPEDHTRMILPDSPISEMREAEDALRALQTQLTSALTQKERLARLGAAVAKISHDLRNILTTAQLFADRIEGSDDPKVQRMVPKLMSSIQRAARLCESTLSFGRAEESAPVLAPVRLADLAADVLDAERLTAGESDISFSADIPESLVVLADGEHLFRVVSNLVRNACQAIASSGTSGEIAINARGQGQDGAVITVVDTGPGLPPKAREHLFQPFQGGARQGGSGLGLAIASDLIRAHGGTLTLTTSTPEGTTFEIHLPENQQHTDKKQKNKFSTPTTTIKHQ